VTGVQVPFSARRRAALAFLIAFLKIVLSRLFRKPR
jgi:hypothetical protein